MIILLILSFIITFISNLLIIISFIISKKSILDREKCLPFECEFDPKCLARILFSLHFFLITTFF